MKTRHTIGGLAALSALAASLLIPLGAANAAEDFYAIPATLPAQNGTIVKQEASSFYLEPLKLTPAQAQVQRIMYKSTDSQGQPIAATGTVLMPKTPWLKLRDPLRPWLGVSERPLVAFNPGTKGNGDQCAPSKRLATGEDYEGAIVKGLLTAGYAVTIPDYQGVGTAPKSTYMARVATGNAVLDAVRAAQRSGLAGLPGNGPVLLSGYSQGGEATAAASELAASYAPELKIIGAYAGAVPANLLEVAKFLEGGLYQAFLLSAVSGIATAENIDLTRYANAAGLAAIAQNDGLCTVESIAPSAFQDTAKYTLSGQKLSVLAQTDPTIRAALEKQLIGKAAPTKFPVLVAQSLLDDVIEPTQTKAMAQQWCQGGATVQFENSVVPTHVGAAAGFLPTMFGFLADRVNGSPAVNNCAAL